MGFNENDVLGWFAQYAYQPMLIYSAIFCLMLASGFGLPIPEELTLISTGMVCYAVTRPDLVSPPYPGATPVNAYIAAAVAFFSVLFSDSLVYYLGHTFGGKLLRSRYLSRFQDRMEWVSVQTKRYGMWAAGFFRFTPGLRFPGHFACGMLNLRYSRFLLVDSAVALISVPTQVLLLAIYGDTILVYFKKFKIAVFILIAIAALYYLIAWLRRRRQPTGPSL